MSPPVDVLTRAADRYGIRPDDVLEAARRIATGEVDAIAMSGKQGSGKDVHAEAVMANRERDVISHRFFAEELKVETNEIVDLYVAAAVQAGADNRSALIASFVAALDDQMGIPASNATDYAAMLEGMPVDRLELWDALRRDELPAHEQPVLREILQYHGTECRRAQDENYWVARALRPAVADVLAGRNVYFTDTRFPNEADAVREIGMYVFRLDVSPEIQRQRLLERDGSPPNPKSLLHASELSLDDYPRFHLRVDNDGPFETTQRHLLEFLDKQDHGRLTAA